MHNVCNEQSIFVIWKTKNKQIISFRKDFRFFLHSRRTPLLYKIPFKKPRCFCWHGDVGSVFSMGFWPPTHQGYNQLVAKCGENLSNSRAWNWWEISIVLGRTWRGWRSGGKSLVDFTSLKFWGRGLDTPHNMTLRHEKLETRPYMFKPWFHVFFWGESVTFWECMVGMRISTPSMQWPGGFSSYFEANRMPEQNLSFFTIPSWEELNCIPVHSSDSFSVFFGPSVRENYLAESLGYGMHWIHGIPFFTLFLWNHRKKEHPKS